MVSLGIALLVLGSGKQTSVGLEFAKSFGGAWGDVDGRLIVVDEHVLNFYVEDRLFQVAPLNIASSGLYNCHWKSSKKVSHKPPLGYDCYHYIVDEDAERSGEGFIKLGNPNSQGAVRSFDISLTGPTGNRVFSGSFAYICSRSQMSMSGHYADDVFDITLKQERDRKSTQNPYYSLGGQVTVNNKKYLVKGDSICFSGYASMLDPNSDKELGEMTVLWAPTSGRVTDLFQADSFETNCIRARIYLKDGTFPNGTIRTIKVKQK